MIPDYPDELPPRPRPWWPRLRAWVCGLAVLVLVELHPQHRRPDTSLRRLGR